MEKGKVVIISGNKRAGKTTTTIKLHKEHGFNFYNFDSLADSIEEVHKNLEGDPYYIKLLTEMTEFSLKFAEDYGVNTVFEYIDFTPELMSNFKYKDKVEIYYLANLDATEENIAEDLKKFSKSYDWPSYVSEEDLQRNYKFILNFNEDLKRECEKYGFELINTSRGENREKVIDNLVERIIQNKA